MHQNSQLLTLRNPFTLLKNLFFLGIKINLLSQKQLRQLLHKNDKYWRHNLNVLVMKTHFPDKNQINKFIYYPYL